jgi:hypothetical protein
MEPNTKLLIDKLTKIREEIKEGFTNHEITITNCFAKFSVVEQQRNTRISNNESTAAEFDKTFGQWKPEVNASLSTIKLELTMLNTFFDREVKNTSASKPRVLSIESAPDRPVVGSAIDDPHGHRADLLHRDRGFESVYSHPYNMGNGMMFTPPPLPNSPFHSEFHGTIAVIRTLGLPLENCLR